MRFKSNSYKQGAIYSSSLGIVARFVAFIQNLLIAYIIGANASTDIYFYLFNLSLLYLNMGQNITTSVLIPYFTQLRNQSREKEGMAYINTFLFGVVCAGVILIAVVWLSGTYLLNYISGFGVDSIRENAAQIYLFAPVIAVYLLNAVMVEIFVSYKYFMSPVLLNLINNTFIILFILFFSQSLGILAAVVGLGVASLLSFIWLVVLLKKKINWQFSVISFALLKPSLANIGTIGINQLFFMLVSTFPMYLLSWLHPSAVTIVNYAVKLAQTPVNILLQIFAVFQIKLNELMASKAYKEMKHIYIRLTGSVALITFLGAIVLFVLRSLLIDLFYGYGGMQQDMLLLLKEIFGVLVFAIPLSLIATSSAKVFFATRRVKAYTIIILVVGMIDIGVNYVLIHKIGIMGFAYAFVIYEAMQAVTLSYFGYRILKKAN